MALQKVMVGKEERVVEVKEMEVDWPGMKKEIVRLEAEAANLLRVADALKKNLDEAISLLPSIGEMK